MLDYLELKKIYLYYNKIMTNLQRFTELYKDEPNIEQFILDNFNNQEAKEYELNGNHYYIFNPLDVQDQLNDDFEEELYDFIYNNERNYPEICKIIEREIDYTHNYKTVRSDYDSLKNYSFEASDGTIYVYLKN